MTNKRKPYKTYPREFKVEAVRLMTESGKPSSELAAELGIRRNQLYKWKEQLENKGKINGVRVDLINSIKSSWLKSSLVYK